MLNASIYQNYASVFLLVGVRSSVNFDMYSGFITVNETYRTKSFYW